jgi:cbb3-type cytochrome oxidase subunit 3
MPLLQSPATEPADDAFFFLLIATVIVAIGCWLWAHYWPSKKRRKDGEP